MMPWSVCTLFVTEEVISCVVELFLTIQVGPLLWQGCIFFGMLCSLNSACHHAVRACEA